MQASLEDQEASDMQKAIEASRSQPLPPKTSPSSSSKKKTLRIHSKGFLRKGSVLSSDEDGTESTFFTPSRLDTQLRFANTGLPASTGKQNVSAGLFSGPNLLQSSPPQRVARLPPIVDETPAASLSTSAVPSPIVQDAPSFPIESDDDQDMEEIGPEQPMPAAPSTPISHPITSSPSNLNSNNAPDRVTTPEASFDISSSGVDLLATPVSSGPTLPKSSIIIEDEVDKENPLIGKIHTAGRLDTASLGRDNSVERLPSVDRIIPDVAQSAVQTASVNGHSAGISSPLQRKSSVDLSSSESENEDNGNDDNQQPREDEEEHFDAAAEMNVHEEERGFAQFLSQVKGRDLDSIRREIDDEIHTLNQQRKAAMRDSEDITQAMVAQIMVCVSLLLSLLREP